MQKDKINNIVNAYKSMYEKRTNESDDYHYSTGERLNKKSVKPERKLKGDQHKLDHDNDGDIDADDFEGLRKKKKTKKENATMGYGAKPVVKKPMSSGY